MPATGQLLLVKDVMAFTDRIGRTVELAHPPARGRTALTTAEGLVGWFGQQAASGLRPDELASMT